MALANVPHMRISIDMQVLEGELISHCEVTVQGIISKRFVEGTIEACLGSFRSMEEWAEEAEQYQGAHITKPTPCKACGVEQ